MKKLLLDTNILLRFFLNDIPKQKKIADKLFQEAKKGGLTLIVSQIVIFELDFILEKYYRFSKGLVIDRLKTLVVTKYLKVESREIFILALNLYGVTKISFVDCFLLSKAKLSKSKILSFDKELVKLQEKI